MGCRLADDLKEFSHKTKAVCSDVEQSVDVDRCLNLTLVSINSLGIEFLIATPHSTILQ